MLLSAIENMHTDVAKHAVRYYSKESGSINEDCY